MHQERPLKRVGGHVVVIGGSRGISLAAARLAQDEVAEVTIADQSPEKLVQAQQELGQVHLVVIDLTDEGSVEKALQASAASTLGSSRPGRLATARWAR
jgi:NAD(P)-dependent dehydrogenase (short-subunit alcohol dehydrogenase family)